MFVFTDQAGEHEHTLFNNYTRQVNTNIHYEQLDQAGEHEHTL
jgi:hypothetical protein